MLFVNNKVLLDSFKLDPFVSTEQSVYRFVILCLIFYHGFLYKTSLKWLTVETSQATTTVTPNSWCEDQRAFNWILCFVELT